MTSRMCVVCILCNGVALVGVSHRAAESPAERGIYPPPRPADAPRTPLRETPPLHSHAETDLVVPQN